MNDEQQPVLTEQPSEQPPRLPITPPIQPEPKSKKRLILIVSAVVLVLLVSGAAYALFGKNTTSQTDQSQTTKSTTVPQVDKHEQENSAPLYTYVKEKSQDLIVVNDQQKTLATLTIKSGNNTFSVLANNGKSVLVSEAYITSGPDSNASLYLVAKDGKITELTGTTASTIKAASQNGFLYGGDYLNVDCVSGTCTLKSLNLATGENTVVYSVSGNQGTMGSPNTLELLGVSEDGLAYTVVYPASGTSSAGTLTIVSIKDKKAGKTLLLDKESLNIPQLSPDTKYLVFTPVDNQQAITLVDTSTGKSTTITPSVPSGAVYMWSPDSTKAAFITNHGTKPVQVAYLDVATSKVIDFKNYGSPETNNLVIDGWASNSLFTYRHTEAMTPHFFVGGKTADYTLDTASSNISAKTVLAGYRIVAAGNSSFAY